MELPLFVSFYDSFNLLHGELEVESWALQPTIFLEQLLLLLFFAQVFRRGTCMQKGWNDNTKNYNSLTIDCRSVYSSIV